MFGAWKVGPGPNQKQSRGAEYHYWGTPMLVRAHYPHWVVFRSTVRAGRRQRLVWFCELAKKSAGEAFRAPPPIPDYLKSLSYDQYRDIRFDVKRSLWRDRGNFQLQLIHPGFLYGYAVRLNTIEAGVAKRVNFDPTLFTYGRNKFAEKIPADLGFAGFRVAYPLNQRSQFDHVVVFAGASYFRGVAKGEVFGLSARGLAIDTGLPSGEEFPLFTEFWLERPADDARQMTLYALLDSPSVTGAYAFVVHRASAPSSKYARACSCATR
jgi:glucans biosynthesis protein